MMPVWVAPGIAVLYLLLSAVGTQRASRAAGRRMWLFGAAQGSLRSAALGFRAGFALSILGPVVELAQTAPSASDPLWTGGGYGWLAAAGAFLSAAGAALALAAQRTMRGAWRVGVAEDEVRELITGGPFRFSRNPAFLGQGLLLLGILVALPGAAAALGLALFLGAATIQIRAEERVLRAVHGAAYDRLSARVPRWIGLGEGVGNL